MAEERRTRASSTTTSAISAAGVSRQKTRRKNWIGWAYLVPVFVLLFIVYAYPLVRTVWFSVHETSFFEVGDYVGLENFTRLGARRVGSSAVITAKFAIATLLLSVPMGLGAALFLQRFKRSKALMRSLLLLPWLMSQATAGAVWAWFLNPSYGPVTWAAQEAGFGKIALFSSTSLALPTLIGITAWWTYPMAMIFFIGSLQSVPKDLYEAVTVDGGGAWASFRYVTLPHIRNTVVVVSIVLGMMYVNMVTMFLVTTSGGPARRTETLSLRIFNQIFRDLNLASAATTSLVVFAINATLLTVAVRLRRRA